MSTPNEPKIVKMQDMRKTGDWHSDCCGVRGSEHDLNKQRCPKCKKNACFTLGKTEA